MPTNARHFLRRLRVRTHRVTEEQLPAFIRHVGYDALTRVVEKTPVDTGRARGNWQINIDQVGTGAEVKSKSGERTKNAGLARLQAVKPGQTIFITNNVPYIIPLEFGHSQMQAAQGMVRLTAAELRAGGIFR